MERSTRRFVAKILTFFWGESKLLITKLKRNEMHYELCRKCGGELTNWSRCFECLKPIKRICIQCGFQTDEIIHSQCFYRVEAFQTQNPMGFGSVEIEPEMRI